MLYRGWIVYIKLIIGGFYLVISGAGYTEDLFRLWHRNSQVAHSAEFIELLAQLSVEEYGSYRIEVLSPREQGRVRVELSKHQGINVMVAGADQQLEHNALPIFYPVDRGLLGVRVCLVRAGEQRLQHIDTLSDWRKNQLTIGVGAVWPDRFVLEANNIPVVTSHVYRNLFPMLLAKRFDCFARSINEIEEEFTSLASPAYEIDPHLAIIYPMANFIYVSPHSPQLYARLKEGLSNGLKNGAIDAFYREKFGNTLGRLGFANRKLLFLPNLQLSPQAQFAIDRYGAMSLAP